MNFFLRYWTRVFVNTVKNSLNFIAIPIIITFLIGLFQLAVAGFRKEILFLPFVLLIAGFVMSFFWTIIAVTITVLINYKQNKMLNDLGFCREYLEYYEKEVVARNPKDDMVALMYAEIHMKMGDPVTAISVLDTRKIPENNIHLRAAYIHLYMTCALKMEDSALADDIWRTNQQFLNQNLGKNRTAGYNHMLYLTLIYADCAAGRYERALKTLDSFMGSKLFRRYRSCEGDMRIIRMYLLKKLGRTAEFNSYCQLTAAFLAEYQPLFDSEKAALQRDFQKAMNGELPI